MNTNVAQLNTSLEVAAPDMQAPHATHTANMLMNPQIMQSLDTFAAMMAGGVATVPSHLRKNKADCMAIVMQAAQWGMNPYAVAQKTHLTQGGQLGYEAQLVNAVITANGPFVGRPDYEFIGDWEKILGKVAERQSDKGGKYYVADWNKTDETGLGVIISATLKGEDEPRKITLMLSQCYPRFSTQWATDPQQQISYAGLKKFARRFCPDVILGVYTIDEIEAERVPHEREINPNKVQGGSSQPSSLKNRVSSGNAQTTAGPTTSKNSVPVNEGQPMPSFDQPPPVDQLLKELQVCATKEDLDQWKAAATQWPEGSAERTSLIQSYKDHCSNLSHAAQNQEQ